MRTLWLFTLLLLITLPVGARKQAPLVPVQVKLLSNPVGDHLRLHIQSSQQRKIALSLEDLEGNRHPLGAHQVGAETWLVLPVANFPAGLYFLHVQDQEQQIRKRVLKQ